jgi:hypothetical protein
VYNETRPRAIIPKRVESLNTPSGQHDKLLNAEADCRQLLRGRVSKQVTNGRKTAVMDVIGFLYVSLGSSTVQLHDTLGIRGAH